MVFSAHEFIIISLSIALAGYLLMRAATGKSATLFWLVAASLAFFADRAASADVPREAVEGAARVIPVKVRGHRPRDNVPAVQPKAAADPSHPQSGTDSPLMDAILQNTRGCSEAYPVGVPRNYSWYIGANKRNAAPPAGFTAVMGWGQIYPQAGTEPNAGWSGKIEVAREQTWVRLKSTKQWMLAQDQAKTPLVGGYFVANFAGNASIEMQPSPGPDGTVFDPPPSGYNAHFWLAARGTYSAGAIDGVYVQMDIRTTETKANLIANIGADWWRDATADFAQGFANNPGAGMSNWVKLSTDWSRLRFFSLDASEFRKAPPPPLAESSDSAMPPVTGRPVGAVPSPCLKAHDPELPAVAPGSRAALTPAIKHPANAAPTVQ